MDVMMVESPPPFIAMQRHVQLRELGLI
jgi:hypothetical protein